MAGEQILALALFSVIFVSARVFPASHHRFYDDDDQLKCYHYKCREKTQHFTPGTCIFWQDSTNTYYLEPCTKKGESCSSANGFTNVTCAEPTPELGTAYPGELCNKNEDCVSNHCSGGLCVGKAINEACEHTTDCNSGLYCPHHIGNCTRLMAQNTTGCTEDSHCDYDSICSPIPNHAEKLNWCIPYFSLGVDHEISSCGDNYIEPKCSTGICMAYDDDDDDEDDEGNKGYCAAVEASYNDPSTTKCTYDHKMCKSASGKQRTSCECGHNPNGDAYCNLFPGDDAYSNYIKYYKKWVHSGKAKKCNSARRDQLACMKAHWDSEDYSAYHYYQFLTENWPQLQSVEDCSNAIYYNEYTKAKKEYKDSQDDDDDSASYLVMAAAILLAIL